MNIKKCSLGPIKFAAITAVASLLSLTGCGAASTEINLSDYIVFNPTGYETYGTAECWFDAESFAKDVDTIFAEKDMWNEKKYSQEQMDLAVGLYHDYYTPIADKTSENAQDRTFRCSFNLRSQKYSNLDSYYLIIADETGLQMPIREEFQIDIAFAVDEFNFF